MLRARMCRQVFLSSVVVVALTSAGATTLGRVGFRGFCLDVPEPDLLEVWVAPEGEVVFVRLAGLDRRSLDQAYPYYAHVAAESWALDRPVRVEVVDRADDGVVTGRVIVDHQDLSYRMISEGLARYDGRAPAAYRLDLAEAAARDSGRGLWAFDREAEAKRQRRDSRELRLSDIAWRLDAQRARASTASVEAVEGGEEAGVEMRLGSWVGVHASLVIANWGEPTRVEAAADGGSVLVYERCGPEAEAIPGVACRVLFFTTDDGTVSYRVWETP